MSEFIIWFEKRYNMPYPGVPHEPTVDVFARVADAMAEWATICANKARNGTSKFIRAEKRRVRSQKRKEVVACDMDALESEIVVHCPTVSQLALVKEAKEARNLPGGISDIGGAR